MNEDEILANVYSDFLIMINKYAQQNVEPIVIAAVLMAQALSLYKTSLSEEDYNSMIDKILESKELIPTFKSGSNGGMLH